MAYTVNGEAQTGIADPMTYKGTTYVPLAHLVELMGGYVTWDNVAKAAHVELGSAKLTVTDGSSSVQTDSAASTLSGEATVENNTLYVPVDFFQSVLGSSVTVNGNDVDLGMPTLG